MDEARNYLLQARTLAAEEIDGRSRIDPIVGKLSGGAVSDNTVKETGIVGYQLMLHAERGGRAGRRRHKIKGQRSEMSVAFLFSATSLCCAQVSESGRREYVDQIEIT